MLQQTLWIEPAAYLDFAAVAVTSANDCMICIELSRPSHLHHWRAHSIPQHKVPTLLWSCTEEQHLQLFLQPLLKTSWTVVLVQGTCKSCCATWLHLIHGLSHQNLCSILQWHTALDLGEA